MKKGEVLFNLIKRLTKSEKRYFKRFTQLVGSKEEKDYLVVFELLERQKEYKEKELRTKLKDLNVKRPIANIENYLLDKLLNSLTQYNRNKNLYISYWSELEKTHIMLRKGLYEAAEDTLKKLHLLPDHKKPLYHSYMYALWHDSLMYSQTKSPDVYHKVQELTQSWLQHLEGTTTEVTYLHLLAEISHIYQTPYYKLQEEKSSQLEKLLQHDFLTDESRCITISSKINRFYCLFYIYSYLNHHEALLHKSKDLLQVLRKDHEAMASILIEVWGTYLLSCIKNKKNKTFLKELKHYDNQSEYSTQTRHFYVKNYASAIYAIQNNKPQFALDQFEELDTHFSTYQAAYTEDHIQEFYFHIGVCLFMDKKYTEGLNWLNQWLLNKKRPLEDNFFFALLILYLFFQTENENFYLANRIIDLRKRQLKKNEETPEFVFKFMALQKTLNNTLLKDFRTELVKKTKLFNIYTNLLDLLDQTSDEEGRAIFQTFRQPLKAWVKEKINLIDIKQLQDTE